MEKASETYPTCPATLVIKLNSVHSKNQYGIKIIFNHFGFLLAPTDWLYHNGI